MDKRTKILCLDVDKKIIDFLSEDFDVYNGSLGSKVNIEEVRDAKLSLNYDFPENLHEYDVLVDEMLKENYIKYSFGDHKKGLRSNDKLYYFECNYHVTIFDPIPYSAKLLSVLLSDKKDKPIIKILFHDSESTIQYRQRNVADIRDYYNVGVTNYAHVTSFTKNVLIGQNVLLAENEYSKTLFQNSLDKITYKQTFRTALKAGNKSGKTICDDNFIPLLFNQNNDIVSYIHVNKYEIVFLFPQMKVEDKIELLKTLFNEILYKYFSEHFPSVQQKQWTKNALYYLPGHSDLLHEDKKLDVKYKEDKSKVKRRIEDNYDKHSFLHRILTDTGDELVSAIKEYLEWLGFKDIVIKDEETKNGVLEEDMQVEIPGKGLLVIEIKGIGGTSKDTECSQISKIKFRRCEERKKFDVFALYIVNNERYIEPLKRTLPPFNTNQLRDAKNEKRGLMFTWQLFNLYFNVENGFISKEDARSRFLQYGLVDFTPSSLINLGKPYKFYQDNKVVCIDLNNTGIKVGDFIVYQENGQFRKEEIISIQVDDENKKSNDNGKTGLGLANQVPNISTAYLLRT